MSPELKKIEDIPFVFIVGRGRSGTSLLQDILGAHPALVAANESPFILKLFKKYLGVKTWTEKLINDFLDDLYDDLQFAHFWNVDRSELRREMLKYPLAELSFQLICKIVYLTVPGAKGKENIRWIVDKNPLYSLYMADMLRMFPQSKFIHIIRDYRDNIISCRKSFGEKDLALLANRWVNYNEHIDQFSKAHKGEVLPIRYEHLAAYPKDDAKRICDFLGISYDEQMLHFYETDKREANTSKEAFQVLGQIHSNLKNPVNTNAVNKWMKELNPEELELIDHIAGKYAATKGYEPGTRVSRWYFGLVNAKKQAQFGITFGLTRTYYFMPVIFRGILRSVSDLLYRTIGYKSRLNRLRLTYMKQAEKGKKP